MNNFYDVEVVGGVKRPRRRLIPLYQKKLNNLSVGQIARINIYNWVSRCNTPPIQYIHRVYKDFFKIIEQDEKGFTVLCLQKRNRFHSKTE
jgi:hypothetical protein